MDSPITRAEHEEFRKRMEEEHKRQNSRIETLEERTTEITDLVISVKELANVLRLDKSGVSRTVEELVLKNLVERRPSVSDRRYVVLSLTPAGIERFEKIENNMNEKFRKILNKIPSDKRKQVIESLELYNTALSKL